MNWKLSGMKRKIGSAIALLYGFSVIPLFHVPQLPIHVGSLNVTAQDILLWLTFAMVLLGWVDAAETKVLLTKIKQQFGAILSSSVGASNPRTLGATGAAVVLLVGGGLLGRISVDTNPLEAKASIEMPANKAPDIDIPKNVSEEDSSAIRARDSLQNMLNLVIKQIRYNRADYSLRPDSMVIIDITWPTDSGRVTIRDTLIGGKLPDGWGTRVDICINAKPDQMDIAKQDETLVAAIEATKNRDVEAAKTEGVK